MLTPTISASAGLSDLTAVSYSFIPGLSVASHVYPGIEGKLWKLLD
jgi:hypothetical protein